MDLLKLEAKELSRRLISRELGVSELLESCISKLEPGARVFYDAARAQAKEVQSLIDSGTVLSPLMGVPVGISQNICVKGELCDAGSDILSGFRPPFTATAVERMKAAGIIIAGSLPGDEFFMEGVDEQTPAAFVARGDVPLALVTDTGGSARMSACWEKLYCVRPTYGTVSRHGIIAYVSSMDALSPTGRSLGDCEALLNIIKGRDPLDGTTFDCPETALIPGEPADFAQLSPDFAKYLTSAYVVLAYAEASGNMARFDGIKYGYRPEEYDGLFDLYNKARTRGLQFRTRLRLGLGALFLTEENYSRYYDKALRVRGMIRNKVNSLLSEHGVLTMPVSDTSLATGMLGIEQRSRYCFVASLAGLPSVTLQSSDMAGRQLVGAAGTDTALISAARGTGGAV